jgi:hypothetical protein
MNVSERTLVVPPNQSELMCKLCAGGLSWR